MDKNEKHVDKLEAKIAFYLSLGFWIPLFNIAICITSLIFAVRALRQYRKDPEHFGGMGYIMAAFILSITALVLTFLGLIIYYFFNDDICGRAICQAYYSSGNSSLGA